MALCSSIESLFRYAYVLVYAPWAIFRFALDATLCLLPWGRPAKEWSINQAVRVRVVRMVLLFISLLRAGDRQKVKPGRERERFVMIQPASPKLYQGPTADALIRPQPLGVTWTPSRPPPATAVTADTTVALHFHGGGFVIGDGRDHDTGYLAKTLVRSMGCAHVCTPEYRLSSQAGGRFPAQLQDAITSYVHLLREHRIPASQIIFSGDSAGANIALALLRYINEYGKEVDIPMPGAATLWSPWVDVHAALHQKASTSPNYHTDYINNIFGAWGAATVSGHGIIDTLSPYLSPLRHPFKVEVPVFVQTGDREVLFADDKELAERYRKSGTTVELVVSRGSPHDILLLGDKMGFAAQAEDAASKARVFLSKTTGLRLRPKTK